MQTYQPVTAKVINRLIMILLTTVLMLLTLLDWELSLIRVLFAVALVAILPGYALTTAIFVNYPLDLAEKIAFSCGLSLGLASIGGLLLNLTYWGLQPASWIVFLGGITLAGNGVALARMVNSTEVDLGIVHIPFRLHQIVLMILAGAVIVGAYLTAQAGAENRPAPGFTQMWILWADEAQTEVKLGIQNQEAVPRQYRLKLSTRQGQVQEWLIIKLAVGEMWEAHYIPPPNVTETDFIKATLYRSDMPQISYREVYLRRVAR